MSKYFIGIDTSNYTTSAAAADGQGKIIASCKRLLPVKAGGVGLRQSEAVFSHVKQLSDIVSQLSRQIGGGELAAVGYSARPRDSEGSYMPCFLVGETVARSIAAVNGVPSYGFSHQAGHIAAALYGSGAEHICGKDFFAFHVSGGTTELLGIDKNDGIELLGGTLDINAGQLIDRVGVMLGMQFPCGPELEKAALRAVSGGAKLPGKPPVCVRGMHCNLSGIENKAKALIDSGVSYDTVALYTIEAVTRTLEQLTQNAEAEFGKRPVLYAGGVTGCSLIRERLTAGREAYFAPTEFSSDNAAGTALLCRRRHLSDISDM